MAYLVATLAFASLGFAGLAFAMAVRKGQLEVDRVVLREELALSEKERSDARSDLQLEGLRDEITDLRNLLDTCRDPDVVLSRLDSMLQKAASRDGDAHAG